MQAEPTHSSNREPIPANLRALLRTRLESFVGEIVFLSGELELEDPATKRRRTAEAGIRVSSQAVLHMKRGQAALRLDDGTDLWLNAGAVLDLSTWKAGERSVRLRAGRMLALVAEELKRPFRALCPCAQVLVTGTAFEAHATANRLGVAVLHGSVEVSTEKGKARGRQGQLIDATPQRSPSVSRLKKADFESPFHTLAASSKNPRVQPALASASNLLQLSTSEEKGMASSSKSKTAGIIALLLIAVGAGAYFMMPKSDAASSAVNDVKAAPAVAATGPASAFGPAHGRQIKFRNKAGNEIVINGEPTPEQLAELRASLPPEAVDQILAGGSMQRSAASAPSGPPDAHEQIIARDASSSREMLNKLVAAGVPPKEAAERVQKAMQDSIRKQMEARGEKGPPPEVRMITNDDGGSLMIGINNPGQKMEMNVKKN